MQEYCPLSGGSSAIGVIPDYCYQHCEALWDAAVRNGAEGKYDIYPQIFDEGECNHEFTDLQTSHDALHAVGTSAARFYVVVDECMGDNSMGCGVEYGEQGYKFHCPQNAP